MLLESDRGGSFATLTLPKNWTLSFIGHKGALKLDRILRLGWQQKSCDLLQLMSGFQARNSFHSADLQEAHQERKSEDYGPFNRMIFFF
jgi:hypothetical protein